MRPLPAGCSEPRSFLQQKRRGCNKTPTAKSCMHGMISFFSCNNATKLQKRLVPKKTLSDGHSQALGAPLARASCAIYTTTLEVPSTFDAARAPWRALAAQLPV